MKIYSQKNNRVLVLGAFNNVDSNGYVLSVNSLGITLKDIVYAVGGITPENKSSVIFYYKNAFIDGKFDKTIKPVVWSLSDALSANNDTSSKYVVAPESVINLPLNVTSNIENPIKTNSDQPPISSLIGVQTDKTLNTVLPYSFKNSDVSYSPVKYVSFDQAPADLYDSVNDKQVPSDFYSDSDKIPVFQIDGKYVYAIPGTEKITRKEQVPIVPKQDVDHVNTLLNDYYNKKITKKDLLLQLQSIDGLQKGYQFKGVPITSAIRSIMSISNYIKSPDGKVISPQDVKNFLKILGVGDNLGQKNLSISQIIALASATKLFLSGKGKKSFGQLINVLPSFIPGVTNSEILDRLDKYTLAKDGSRNVGTNTVYEILQDPVLVKVLKKMGADPNKLGALSSQDAVITLLALKDVIEGKQSALSVANHLRTINGIDKVFPKINNESWLQVLGSVGAVSQDLKYKHNIDSSDVKVIATAFGISDSEFKNLHIDQLTKLYNIYNILKTAKGGARNKALVEAAGELPALFPGVSNARVLDGILRIAKVKRSPKNVFLILASNSDLRAFLNDASKILGVQLFKNNQNGLPTTTINGLNISIEDATRIITVFDSMKSGKLLPLQVAAALMSIPVLRNALGSKASDKVQLALSLDNVVEGFTHNLPINSKDLDTIFTQLNINSDNLGTLNPKNMIFLYNAVRLYKSGDKQGALQQVVQSLPGLLHDNKTAEAIGAGIGIIFDKNLNSPQALIKAIQKSPALMDALKSIHLGIPGSSGTTSGSTYLLDDTQKYIPVAPTQDTKAQGYSVVGTLPDLPGYVEYVDKSGKSYYTTIEDAQSRGIPVDGSSGAKIINDGGGDAPGSKGTNEEFWKSASFRDMLIVVGGVRALFLTKNGKQKNLFQVAKILANNPSFAKYNSSLKTIDAMVNLSESLKRAGKGQDFNVDKFNSYMNTLGVKTDGPFTPGQAAELYSGYIALQKGDISGAISRVLSALPEFKSKDVVEALVMGVGNIKKVTLGKVLQTIYNTPELKKYFADHGLSFLNDKNVDFQSWYNLGTTVLDAIKGKVSPLVAAATIVADKGMSNALIKAFPNTPQIKQGLDTIAVATTIYTTATSFGKTPVDPRDLDKALKGMGLDTNTLPLGKIISFASGVDMILRGNMQGALIQFALIFAPPGVSLAISILAGFFPGIAGALLGAHHDYSTQPCQRCGGEVHDPGSPDLSQAFEADGQICQWCGGKIRSKEKPDVFPGTKPPSANYPFNSDVTLEMPLTRKNINWTINNEYWAKPSYITGNISITSPDGAVHEVSNLDCAGQESYIGTMSKDNVNRFSLFCKDQRAFYGAAYLTGSSDQGTANENNFNNLKNQQNTNDTQQSLYQSYSKESCEKAFTAVFGDPEGKALKNAPEGQDKLDAICGAWNKIMGDPVPSDISANNQQNVNLASCGFLENTRYDIMKGIGNECKSMQTTITNVYKGLPSDYRDFIFYKVFKIKNTFTNDEPSPVGTGQKVLLNI